MTPSPNPASGPSAGLLPGDLGWNLGMVLRGYQTRLEEAVDGMPGGVRGYQVLSTVGHRDPANQQALAAHLVIDRTVLTYLLDTLAEAEVVERIPDPADRRSRKIVATAHGRNLLERYESRVAAAEAELLEGLDAHDAATLSRLLSGLAMSVHRAQPNSSPCEAMDYLP
ncbi:MarR family winged helix-turn-helix transcriptional regulator [Microbacterium aerolatum]|uniref:MarR family winged helix-turn-helix transcriptional regulator n=1 Tax=Microbacterium aerolatum TaxID=153731 RepID=UPI002000B049|nr:MarR family winged helix-turn-helix transcriptional regulator [Microbacterium aerolatum]MCK3770860.1 MarR family winged helix-turn-helix transcriptional regulator [Microbacterium aerolatum]